MKVTVGRALLREKKTKKLIENAEKRVHKFDQIDRGSELRAPISTRVRTIQSALLAGMDMGDWECVADGVVILEQILQSFNCVIIRNDGRIENLDEHRKHPEKTH